MIPLDIISDPVCPWCYIGKARLDAGIKAAGSNPFTRRWRAFQLNPDMPAEGMARSDYLVQKFGPERLAAMTDRIREEATASGIEINYARPARTPNTVNAHRLVRWAAADGQEDPIVDALFQRYFVAGEDIGDRKVLLDIAAAAGLDLALIARLFDGDADVDAVRDEDASFRKMGVTSVPTFVVAGHHVVTGAQTPDLWAGVIAEIDEQVAGA